MAPKAIILAAGKGERLRPLTDSTPKILLEIKNGKPLIDLQIESIVQSGQISEVIFVLGYKAEMIENHLTMKYPSSPKLNIKTIFNPFYEVTNNLVSLWIAKEFIKNETIIINGDDFFKPSVLTGLLENRNGIRMVIDRKDEYDEDDMKVFTKGPLVKDVSKKISNSITNAESIGMIYFDRNGSDILRKTLDSMLRTKESLNVFWLSAIQKLIKENTEVKFHECSRHDWAELDFHIDLQYLKSKINLEDII